MADLSKPTNYVLPMPTGNNSTLLFGGEKDWLRFDTYAGGKLVVRLTGKYESEHLRGLTEAEEQELLAFLLMRHAYRTARNA